MTQTTPHPRVRRPEAVAIIAITVVFAIVLLVWAYATPMLHGPDELANVDAIIQLAMGKTWPAAGKLHYLQGLSALNVPALPPAASVRSSFAQVVGSGALMPTVNPMSQHPATYFFVQAAIAHVTGFASHRWDLVVLLMRFVDVLIMLPLPALIWAAVRRATCSPRTGMVAAALLLAVPQVAQLGSSVSVWVPVITAGGLATWLAIRILTGDRSWWTTIALGCALAIGTAAMSAGYIAVPFAIIAVLAARNLVPAAGRVLRAVVVLVIPAVTTGWWYVYQLVRTGTPQPDAYPSITRAWPKFESPAPTQFAGAFWDGLSTSFWGEFGRYEWPLSPIILDTFTVAALAVIAWGATHRAAGRRTMLIAGLFPLTAVIVVVARDWATYASHLGVTVNQGRFLFPTLSALLIVQAIAWRALIRTPRSRVRLGRTAIIGAPIITLCALGLLYSGSYQGLLPELELAGVGNLSAAAPAGLMPLFVLLALALVTGVAAIVMLWRWFGAALGDHADAAQEPITGEPLNSEPTIFPTQRNNQ